MARFVGLAFCFFAACLGGQAANAASAVAIDSQGNKFAWQSDQDIARAKENALAQCAKVSGSKCAIFTVCGLPGNGAIAFNKTSGNWGAACAAKQADQAREFALENCNLRSQGNGTCEIAGSYNDDSVGGALATDYFSGKWAENCKDKTWHKFRTVNSKEFRLLDCNAAQCTDRQEVFRSLSGETVFHWPTNNTRIRKRGPDTIEVTTVNSKYYNRCGE
ncbi:MAG: DUF4189 domain-containing protein [Proteobacteria bacterium]|nr:DUF4189 domain-containing protein [Pseudomonadota bacterium]